MTFIVWHDNNYDGWSRSEDLATLTDCFEYIRTETYGHPYLITRPVEHELVEVSTRHTNSRTEDVPETSSEERMHVLDETCWCKPTVDDAPW